MDFDDDDFDGNPDDYSGNPTEEQIIALIGEDNMAQLSRDLGGRRLYIAKNPGEHNPLAVSIGLDAARKIGQSFGEAFLEVPLAIGTRKMIIELFNKGVPKVRISAQLRKSIRHVRRVCNDYKPDGIQDDLFER